MRVTVTKQGDSLEVDLTDCHPQVKEFINSSWPNTMSSVHMGFAHLIDPRTPKNEGTFRPITVKAKQETIVWPFLVVRDADHVVVGPHGWLEIRVG